jgi:hypothetical protein
MLTNPYLRTANTAMLSNFTGSSLDKLFPNQTGGNAQKAMTLGGLAVGAGTSGLRALAPENKALQSFNQATHDFAMGSTLGYTNPAEVASTLAGSANRLRGGLGQISKAVAPNSGFTKAIGAEGPVAKTLDWVRAGTGGMEAGTPTSLMRNLGRGTNLAALTATGVGSAYDLHQRAARAVEVAKQHGMSAAQWNDSVTQQLGNIQNASGPGVNPEMKTQVAMSSGMLTPGDIQQANGDPNKLLEAARRNAQDQQTALQGKPLPGEDPNAAATAVRNQAYGPIRMTEAAGGPAFDAFDKVKPTAGDFMSGVKNIWSLATDPAKRQMASDISAAQQNDPEAIKRLANSSLVKQLAPQIMASAGGSDPVVASLGKELAAYRGGDDAAGERITNIIKSDPKMTQLMAKAMTGGAGGATAIVGLMSFLDPMLKQLGFNKNNSWEPAQKITAVLGLIMSLAGLAFGAGGAPGIGGALGGAGALGLSAALAPEYGGKQWDIWHGGNPWGPTPAPKS